MISPFFRWAATLLTLAIPCVYSQAAIVQSTISTGSQSSFLYLESPQLGQRLYEIRYDLGPTSPIDAVDLINRVDAFDADLDFQLVNFGSTQQPNFFLTGISLLGNPETNTNSAPFVPSWVQWAAGGQAGFPTSAPISASSWTLGSGISSPFRILAPGSYDALVFSDFSTLPSLQIPEPQIALLILVGMFCLFPNRVKP